MGDVTADSPDLDADTDGDLDPHLLDGAAKALAKQHGFTLDVGHLALSGVCRSCADTTDPPSPR